MKVPPVLARLRDEIAALRRDEVGKLVALLAAAALGVLVNVYSARHYARWDVTSDRRYTLSDATKTTLRELHEPVEVWVLLGSQEPLKQSVTQILSAYEAESPRLVVKSIDPDKDALALEDLKKRFKIEAGRSEDGHVLTDAVIVVARGEKRWFLDSTDLYEASDKDDGKVRPREEEALTLAIRNVVREGERTRLCFTEGHGEASLQDGSERGLFFFKNVLEKDNFAVATVDTSKPGSVVPFEGCSVVVVPGPRGAFGKDEAAALRTFAMTGGNVLLAVGPVPKESGFEETGLDDVVAPFGIRLGGTLVVETEKSRVIPDSYGARFFAEARLHPVTAGLVARDDREPPRMLVSLARPLYPAAEPGAALAQPLAATSPLAFGLAATDGASTWTRTPEKGPRDPSGPFVVAMAAERAKVRPDDPHGPRMVVIGASTALLEANFREGWAVRGTALLVENAIAWLATKPEIVDVPARPEVAAGMRITEESRAEVRRYVVFLMPLAVALLGLAIGFRRKSTEGRVYVAVSPSAQAHPKPRASKKRRAPRAEDPDEEAR